MEAPFLLSLNPKLGPLPSFSRNLCSPVLSLHFTNPSIQNPSSSQNPNNLLLYRSIMEDSNDKKYITYHPYQDLYNVPSQNLYKIPKSPEYLFQEEAARQRRGWSENLQYYTGTGYLAGAIIGGAKGSLDGIRSAEAGDSMKLRVNRILNSGGQMGRKVGNNMGILGLMFAGIESALINYRDSDDLVNTALAGLGTGAVYRAARGPRSVAIAGAIGGIAAAGAVTGKQALRRYLPI